MYIYIYIYICIYICMYIAIIIYSSKAEFPSISVFLFQFLELITPIQFLLKLL